MRLLIGDVGVGDREGHVPFSYCFFVRLFVNVTYFILLHDYNLAASLPNIPQRKYHSSFNINATDLVHISKDAYCQWLSFDIKNWSVACITRQLRRF